MGHTREPWHIEYECNIFSENHRLVASAGGYQTNAENDRHRLENEANARRIVACVNACEGINPEAVPDLLAACELCLEWMDDVCGIQSPYEEVTIEIKAAIAKAKGET